MKLSQEQIETLTTALLWADVEFREHYHYHWNCSYYENECWEDENDYHFQIRDKCKALGQRALRQCKDGNLADAVNTLLECLGTEGDFSGWADTKVYRTSYMIVLMYYLDKIEAKDFGI